MRVRVRVRGQREFSFPLNWKATYLEKAKGEKISSQLATVFLPNGCSKQRIMSIYLIYIMIDILQI